MTPVARKGAVEGPRVVVCSNTLAEYIIFFQKLLPPERYRTVLFAELSDSEYRRLSRGSLWALLRLRIRMLFVYPCRLLWRMWREAGRAVFLVTTNTFFAPWVAVHLGRKRNLRVVHVLYDLYPEALAVAAGSNTDTITSRLISSLTRSTLKAADGTVFIGRRLRAYAEGRYGAAKRSWVIEVGSDAALFRSGPASGREGPLRMIYSGQLGLMHDVETLGRLLAGPVLPGLEVVLLASGAGYAALRAMGRTTRWCVRWGTPQGTADWSASMQQCHLGLVSVRPGAENVVFPSKAFSALLAGQALVAVCAEDSDLAELVRRHGCGWVVAPGDVEALRGALIQALGDRVDLERRQRLAQLAGQRLYSLEALRPAWERVIEDVSSETAAR